MATLVVNNMRRFKVCAVKALVLVTVVKRCFQDIAILTGGTVVSEELGMSLEKLLGFIRIRYCQKLTVGKENTVIVDGAGQKS